MEGEIDMQLNMKTDYAIRIVLYAAQEKRVVSSTEISAAMAVPKVMIGPMGRRLMAAGILTAKRGHTGGLALARHPADISVGDIIHAMERININRCLDPDRFCSRGAVETCPVHAFYAQTQERLEKMLAGKSVADLLRDAERPAKKGGEGS